MKIEYKDEIVTLTAENGEEKNFLKKVSKEGLRNFGSGSSNVLALPSAADLRQVHLTEKQVEMIIYSLGFSHVSMWQVYGKEESEALQFSF